MHKLYEQLFWGLLRFRERQHFRRRLRKFQHGEFILVRHMRVDFQQRIDVIARDRGERFQVRAGSDSILLLSRISRLSKNYLDKIACTMLV